MVRYLDDDYNEVVFHYRERASINLSQAQMNAVRLRVVVEVVQTPLAPYENLKFNPTRTWYGTCTRLWRGAVLSRHEIEPTASVIFDELNEHLLRRLDDFRMWSRQYEWNVAVSRWLQAFMLQWIAFPAWGEPISDLNETYMVSYLADLMEVQPFCVFAKSAYPQSYELDAFGWNFDQLKFVFPPFTQFVVRVQWWNIADTCDDTIVDLASARQPEPDPGGLGSFDPYSKPRQPVPGGSPFSGLPNESPRNLANDPRDYALAPNPAPSGSACLFVSGTYEFRDARNGNRMITVNEVVGCWQLPWTYAMENVTMSTEDPPRQIKRLRIRDGSGAILAEPSRVANWVSGELTFEVRSPE